MRGEPKGWRGQKSAFRVHGDTTNVSVRGGERERAHLWGRRAATFEESSEAFFNRFYDERDSFNGVMGVMGEVVET